MGWEQKGHQEKKTGTKIRSILALVEQGVSKAEISRALGISIPTIYSIINENNGKHMVV